VGDEIMKKIILQKKIINVQEILQESGTDSDGAVVVFSGRARDHSNGKKVTHLEYEVYEDMAQMELEKIADEANSKWEINDCIIIHRYGRVNIKEESIIISVASSHRDASYQASRYIIDQIKLRVPIWKKEFYSDGSTWITDRH